MPRSIQEIIEEVLREQDLKSAPESLYNQGPPLGKPSPDNQTMFNKEPMVDWGGKYRDQPPAAHGEAIEQSRGDAQIRQFVPRQYGRPQLYGRPLEPAEEFMRGMDVPPPSQGPVNPNSLRGAYEQMPPQGPPRYTTPELPRVPNVDMQQLMDFYINGGSDV